MSALKQRVDRYYSEVRTSALLAAVRRSYIAWSGLRVEDGNPDAIKIGGEDQEMLLMTANETRSVLGLLKTYIVDRDVEFDPLANTDSASTLEACRLAREVLQDMTTSSDYMLTQRLSDACEDALVTGAGYLHVCWDDMAGEEIDGDGTENLYYSGDIRIKAPTWSDVTYDCGVTDMSDSQWVQIRERVNRWDYIKKFPKFAEDLQRTQNSMDSANSIDLLRAESMNTDMIYVYHMYHKRTAACPLGLYACHNGSVVLERRALDQGDHKGCEPITLYRLTAGRWFMSPFGWTPAFSLTGPQEALDAAMSAVVTICNTSSPKYWTEPNTTIGRGELEGFGTVVQCPTKPEELPGLSLPPDLLNALKVWVDVIQRYSGVNATTRGEPQASVKAARALAFIEQRTAQAAADLAKNYSSFVEQVATGILRLLKFYQKHPRTTAVPGANGRSLSKKYDPGAFEALDRVAVVRGNPELGTLGGRLAVAQDMLNAGLVQDPQQYLSVMKTGNLEQFTEVDDGQGRIIASENEALKDGQMPSEPLITDNHVRHAVHHLALLDSPAGRADPQRAPNVLAHVAKHLGLLQDPSGIMYMSLLYPKQPIPPMLLPPPPMPPPGNGPAPPGGPPQEKPQGPQPGPNLPPSLQAADTHAKTAEENAAVQSQVQSGV